MAAIKCEWTCCKYNSAPYSNCDHGLCLFVGVVNLRHIGETKENVDAMECSQFQWDSIKDPIPQSNKEGVKIEEQCTG